MLYTADISQVFLDIKKKQDGTASVIQIFHRAGAAVYEIKGLGNAITVYSDAPYYELNPIQIVQDEN